jgi:hypothetical protein
MVNAVCVDLIYMKNKKDLIHINQSIGKTAPIGIFTGFQFAASLISLGMGFSLAFLLGAGMIWSILIGTWLAITILFLSGKNPHLFWSRIYPITPLWVRGYVKYSNAHYKRKAGSRKPPKSW